jgi:hypothetical protein
MLQKDTEKGGEGVVMINTIIKRKTVYTLAISRVGQGLSCKS